MKAAFAGGSGDIDDRSDVDLCVGCSRKVTYGDFGLDHIMYYKVDDKERKVAKVRTMPRMWCKACAQDKARQMKRVRVESSKQVSLLSKWQEVSSQIRDEAAAAKATGFVAPTSAGRSKASAHAVAVTANITSALRDLVVEVKGRKVSVLAEATVVTGSVGGHPLGEVLDLAGAKVGPDFDLKVRIQWEGRAQTKCGVPVGVTGFVLANLKNGVAPQLLAGKMSPTTNMGAADTTKNHDSLDRITRTQSLLFRILKTKLIPRVSVALEPLRDSAQLLRMDAAAAGP